MRGFADTRGKGFGSIVACKEGVRLRIGVWGCDSKEEKLLRLQGIWKFCSRFGGKRAHRNVENPIAFLNNNNCTVK